MANVFSLYSDYLCKNDILPAGCGLADFHGSTWATISGWNTLGAGGCYYAVINKTTAAGNVSLNGTVPVFDFQFANSKGYEENAMINDNGTKNAFFVSANNQFASRDCSYYMQIRGQKTGAQQQNADMSLTFGVFIQNDDYGEGEPQNGRYLTSATNPASNPYAYRSAIRTNFETSQFCCVAFYVCNISSVDYILCVIGISGTGEMHPTNNAEFILIPRAYFKQNIPRPYVGPVSKDSAAGYTPSTAPRDSVKSRNLTGKTDPYGFNTGNGTKLLIMSAAEQADIVKQLYTGRSEDIMNKITQVVSEAMGGSDHRPAEELQTMINGILCCHMIPVIDPNGYTGSSSSMDKISGYTIYSPAKSFYEVGHQQYVVSTDPIAIPPVVNNFLSWAPYCSVTLTVPFVGDIPVETSAIFDRDRAKSIYFVFFIDLFTGTLSVDVHLQDADGRDYIYTTRQTNCAVDIPIMGTGATGNPLQKIASAAGNIAGGGAAAAPASAYTIASAVGESHHEATIGKAGASNIAPYFACRDCYLVISYPESANPENFFAQHGGVSHLGETVGTFRGTGYTEFEAVDVSGIGGATDAEKREIERVLKGGCFV